MKILIDLFLALFKDFLRMFSRVVKDVKPMKNQTVIFKLAIQAFHGSKGRRKRHKFWIVLYVSIIVVYILQFGNWIEQQVFL